VKEAFIEGKGVNEQDGFERDGYSVRWTMENGLGLVFVVCPPDYRSAKLIIGRLPSVTAINIYPHLTVTYKGTLSCVIRTVPDITGGLVKRIVGSWSRVTGTAVPYRSGEMGTDLREMFEGLRGQRGQKGSVRGRITATASSACRCFRNFQYVLLPIHLMRLMSSTSK